MNLCEWLHSLFLWFIFNSCSHHKIGAMLKKVVGLFTVGRGKRLYFAPVNKITFQPLTLTSPVMQAHANHERDRCKCMRSCFITQWTFGCIGRMDTFFPERHILLQRVVTHSLLYLNDSAGCGLDVCSSVKDVVAGRGRVDVFCRPSGRGGLMISSVAPREGRVDGIFCCPQGVEDFCEMKEGRVVGCLL